MVIGVSRWGGQRRDWEDDQLDMHRRQSLPHLWQMCSLASGVESLLSMSNGGRNSVHRLYGLAGPRQWAGGQKGDW